MGRHGIPVIGFGLVKNRKRTRQTKKPGNLTWYLCRYVRCNPIKLAGNRIITFTYSPPVRRRVFGVCYARIEKNGIVVNADGQAKQDLLIETGLFASWVPIFRRNSLAKKLCLWLLRFPWRRGCPYAFQYCVGIARSCDDFFTGTRAAACAVQQPLLTIWDLAQMAAGYASTGSLSRLCRPQSSHRLQLSGVIQHINHAILDEIPMMVEED